MAFLKIAIFLFGFLIILRLINLQIVQGGFYKTLASDQHEISEELFPERGEIFIRDTRVGTEKIFPLAINKKFNLVYAVPSLIEDPEKVLEKIVEIFNLEDLAEIDEIKERLEKENDPYEPIKHKVDAETAQKIEDLGWPYLKTAPEIWRYYPENNIGSHITGFYGYNEEERMGSYGLEGYFEKELKGQAGYLKSEQDIAGRLIGIGQREIIPAQDGADLVLTIDRTIQYKACEELKEAVEKHGADSGSVVILEPPTGAILAMCNYPDFNPNEYDKVLDASVYNNASIFYQYEPGSIFKPISMAAALDQDLITPEDTFVDEGFVQIGPHTIRNADDKVYGEQTMKQVLDESINTGVIYVVRKLGTELFREYVEKFGFGSPTGVELNTEESGDIKSLYEKGEIYSATASYGQGISVTPLQLVMAYATMANQGQLMKPYIVAETRQGDKVVKTVPEVVRQVISPGTANLISSMLVSVVENGHGKRAGVKGYYVGGKTGTAQVPKKTGPGYEKDITIGSFAGFAPVEDPRFAMVVKIENPKDVIWAESSAAPLFGKIAEFILRYYEVPPERVIE